MLRRSLLPLLLALAPALAPAQTYMTFQSAIAPEPARAGERVVLTITCKVEPGYHAYGAKEPGSVPITVTVDDAGGLVVAGGPEVPDGHLDKTMGIDQWVLDGTFEIKQSFDVPKDAKPGKRTVKVTVPYMVCDDNHCEPPAEQPLAVTLTIAEGEARAEHLPKPAASRPSSVKHEKGTTSKPTGHGAGTAGPGSEDSQGEGGASGDLWAFLLAAVGWGLFTLAMPCTYPMIPITITFFTKQASARGGSVFPLAMTYGIGIVAMFVLIGLVVGEPIIAVAQHWVTQLVIGGVFVVFALSLFGVLTIQPPAFLMNLASQAGRRGGYSGVFLMGFFFVITSFTCTAPFVASLLSFGATSGSLGRVALGMAVFGLTMAIPFAILALVPGRLRALPKAGEWMHVLKVTLGFVELAAALKFFSTVDMQFQLGILPRELFLWIWAILFGVTGIYLLGLVRMHGDSAEGIGPVRMTHGVLFLLLATYCGFGGGGNKLHWVVDSIAPDYHAPVLVESAKVGKAGSREPAADGVLLVQDDLEAARKLATERGRWVLVNFTGFG